MKDWTFSSSYTLPAGATIQVSGTLKIEDTAIFRAVSDAVTVTGEGKIDGNIVTSSTSDDGTSTTISPGAGEEISSALVSDAFTDSNVNTVTITSGTISSSGLDLTSAGLNSGDKIVLGSDVTIENNATFTVPKGVSIGYTTSTGTNFSVTSGGSKATFQNFSGNYTVTGGSIVVSGNGTGTILAEDGSELKFTGTVGGDIQVSWDNTSRISSGKVIFDNATISSNCTITLDPVEEITYSVNGELRVYGSILNSSDVKPIETISISVPEKNSVKAYASATIGNGIYFEGDGNIDLGSSMSTGYWSEDIASDMTWSQAQKTIIDGTMTIKSGYTLTILGELVIDENVTVYIEKGATLQIGNANGATAVGITVNGNIEVAQGGSFDVQNAKAVTISGELYSEGIIHINSNVSVEDGGSIIIDESYDETSASKITVEKGLTIEAGGSLTISSEMTITEIKNKGTVTLDDAILTGKSTIYQVADGAVVNIVSVTGGSTINSSGVEFRVSDVGLVFETDRVTGAVDDVDNYVDDNVFSTTITPGKGFGGLTITESVTSEKIGDETNYSNYMYLSGDIEAVDENDEPSFSFKIRGDGRNDGGIVVGAEDSLNLGEGVKMTLNYSRNSATDASSTFTVNGTFTAVESNGQFIYETSTGKIDVYVTGMITTKDDAIDTYINAFHYETTGTNGANYYTTLATALTNATQIDYIGDVEVMESVTVPNGVRITAASSATLTIGDQDNRDVVLTVANGGILRNNTTRLDVNGTLVFENNKDGNKGNNIISDVQIFADPQMTYTNIYTALDNASSGTVEIRPDADVILNNDIEVKEGVTLVIPDSAKVTMYNGVTLTVNGTVENSGDIVNSADPESGDAAAGFNPVVDGKANTDASKIVVNGAFKSMDYTYYSGAPEGEVSYYIPGAYYQIIDTEGSWYWITPVEDAAAVAANVDDGIAIYGEVTVGDIAFAGSTEKNADPVVITVYGELTAGTITLTNAQFTVPDTVGQFDGTVATAVGSIDLVNIRNVTITATVDNDDNPIMTLAGTPLKADTTNSGADASVTIATGDVVVNGQLTIESYDEVSNTDGISVFEIAEGATVTVMDASSTQAGELKADNLTVNGTLVAIDGGNVNVIGTLTVRGMFTVAEETDDNGAGTASVAKLLIGIAINDDGEYGNASAATVNADNIQNLGSVVMSAESTFTGDQVDAMKPTEFYIEGALWIIAYAGATADDIVTAASGSATVPTYGFKPADMTESEFLAWNDADGKVIKATTKVGGIEAVYAYINYDVYKVVVMTDNSIGSVAIDGQLLIYSNGGYVLPGNGYEGALLDAGQHTITYTLTAGYEGTATLTSNGVNATVSGMTFTLSGDFEDANSVTNINYLTLGGATYTGNTVVIDNGNDGSGDMGLTDYLLIILVILIVVMAIIVALRLMRS